MTFQSRRNSANKDIRLLCALLLSDQSFGVKEGWAMLPTLQVRPKAERLISPDVECS